MALRPFLWASFFLGHGRNHHFFSSLFVLFFFQYKLAPQAWEDQWVDVLGLVAREVDNQDIGKHWFGASYKMGSRWKSVASNAALDDVPFCLFVWAGLE